MSTAETTGTMATPGSKVEVNSRRTEANRRNAKKSTGPRTPEGKNISRHNAVTHGMTARSPLLPGEDADELFARQRALRDDMQPRNELEAMLLDRVGAHMFRADRAELSGDAQASNRIRHAARQQAKAEKAEVLKLGERLLWKPALPRPVDSNHSWTLDEPPVADEDAHPQYPGRILLQLEWTVAGCDWLLERWAELNRRLNVEGPWRPVDAFRMVRLTGKHAIDLEDDYGVARVLLCSLTLTIAPKPGPQNEPFDWVSALIVMLYSFNREHAIKTVADLARFRYASAFKHRWAELPLAKLAPPDGKRARQWLTGVIEGEIKRVREIRAELVEIAAADAAEAPARLTYEIGAEGEKHRRYLVTNERLVSKTVNDFFKARNMSESGKINLVSRPLSVVSGEVEAIDEPDALDAAVVENAKSEPTEAEENATSEIRLGADGEDGRSVESVASIDDFSRHSPIPATHLCGTSEALFAGTNDAYDQEFGVDLDRERGSKLLWDEVAKRVPKRAEDLRKLNDECRRDDLGARAAARRARRCAKKNGTPTGRETPALSPQEEASCDDVHFLRNEANLSGVSGPLTVVSSTGAGHAEPRAADEPVVSVPDPVGPPKLETVGRSEPGSSGGATGVRVAVPTPTQQTEIEARAAKVRLGEEIARQAMMKAENIRRLGDQQWNDAEAAERAHRARQRGHPSGNPGNR